MSGTRAAEQGLVAQLVLVQVVRGGGEKGEAAAQTNGRCMMLRSNPPRSSERYAKVKHDSQKTRPEIETEAPHPDPGVCQSACATGT